MLSRFHECHGSNIYLLDDSTVAYRIASYANGITFSENPLLPGEIFLVEIEENEPGWSGYLRLGLTMVDPNDLKRDDIPQYAMPYFTDAHYGWVFPVTNRNPDDYGVYARSDDILGRGWLVMTPRGNFPRTSLLPRPNHRMQQRGLQLPVDVGSKVGVMYYPCKKNTSDEPDYAIMHFIINGKDYVACSKKIPYKKGTLHAVVDVYGATKQVKIVQLYCVKTLQMLCRDVIVSRLNNRSVATLMLPKMIKNFLQYTKD